MELGRHPQGVVPLPRRINRDDACTGVGGAGDERAQRPGEPGRSEQHDAFGEGGLRAHDGIGSGDGPTRPASRQRVRQHRPAEGAASPATPTGFALRDQGPPAMIIPLPRRGSSSIGARPAGCRPRRPSDPYGREVALLRRSAARETPNSGAPGRARFAVHRFLVSPDGKGSPCGLLALDGYAGRRGPTNGCGEEPVLVDGLRCARVMEFGWPVRRAHNQRDTGMVRLDDGRVQFGGGSAARHTDDGRPPRRHCQAQGEERSARSSSRTWTWSRSASGRASGVEREPRRRRHR